MKYIITIIITFIISFITIFYNIKITDVENGNIEIDVFGVKQTYYFEKEEV